MSPARRTLALAACAALACASYALQRLLDARGEPPMSALLYQAHTPYYWRMALAAMHGVAAGLLLAFGLGDAEAERWLGRAPTLLALLVLSAAAAMVIVP